MATDAQVWRLREKRMAGNTLTAAAAAAGMSERTARTWQRGALPSTAQGPRRWRTREDPFADVWQSEVVPQLVADTGGRLQVLTLFKALCRRHPGRFQPGQLRTLQRRVRDWRVQDGPDREVYFEQVAVPGREAAFDFTDASDLGVTLRGVGFPHLLFEWVLSYSRWTYVRLALSETFEARVAGVQGALWTLGAVPGVLRHDNLSAATHELRRSGGRQLTVRFRQVLDHYGLRSSRIQPGKPHENGVAEQAHFRTKTAIEQALLLRGDRDFDDESAYLRFVRAVVDEARNAAAVTRLAEERPYLRPLPAARIPEYTAFQCVVRKWSTIRVGGRTYSVPSRLIGHTVEARQHPSTVEVVYGGRVLCTMPRLRGAADHRIDYRHIIRSCPSPPGAARVPLAGARSAPRGRRVADRLPLVRVEDCYRAGDFLSRHSRRHADHQPADVDLVRTKYAIVPSSVGTAVAVFATSGLPAEGGSLSHPPQLGIGAVDASALLDQLIATRRVASCCSPVRML